MSARWRRRRRKRPKRDDLTGCVKLNPVWGKGDTSNRRRTIYWLALLVVSGTTMAAAYSEAADRSIIAQGWGAWVGVVAAAFVLTCWSAALAGRGVNRWVRWKQLCCDRLVAKFVAVEHELAENSEALRMHLQYVVGTPSTGLGSTEYEPTKQDKTTVKFPRAHLRKTRARPWSRATWWLNPGRLAHFNMADGIDDLATAELYHELIKIWLRTSA